jgi:hypothetical protein
MYDQNDRSRGQANGNVNGATKGGNQRHGADEGEAVRWMVSPCQALGKSSDALRRLMDRENRARVLVSSPGPAASASLPRGSGFVPIRSRSCRSRRAATSHIASAGPVQRQYVHVVHGLEATSHKGVIQPRRRRHALLHLISGARQGRRSLPPRRQLPDGEDFGDGAIVCVRPIRRRRGRSPLSASRARALGRAATASHTIPSVRRAFSRLLPVVQLGSRR